MRTVSLSVWFCSFYKPPSLTDRFRYTLSTSKNLTHKSFEYVQAVTSVWHVVFMCFYGSPWMVFKMEFPSECQTPCDSLCERLPKKKIHVEVGDQKKLQKKGRWKIIKKTSIYSSCHQCDDAIVTHVARAVLCPKDSPNGPKLTELSHFFDLQQKQ